MLKKALLVATLGGLIALTALIGSSRAASTQLPGVYRARVVSNADPELRHRLLVNVTATGATAWALGSGPYGSTATPPVGAIVWVAFEAGDPSLPVWIGVMH
jgi:hypothetical protein